VERDERHCSILAPRVSSHLHYSTLTS
jgi:hypothetical protein